ncbi:ABC transporter permease [Halobacillus sp. A5]|uniref:putative ABC transporter permease subunit n=1 Tax=Halobacillus sp. A5 TaxID=2880263 RepID=UPI0020A67EEF|nr:ABC transporter permease [Halobacillus sp. A5]MCP3026799.1 ABC transporter permease [Halobacillus sp. A5]
MNKTLKLIRLMLKMQFSMAGKSSSEKVGYLFLLLFSIPFSIMIFYAMDGIIGGLYDVLEPLNNQSFILGLLFISMFAVFTIVSIGSIISSFYFAEDIESFISLPYHPYQIMIGKSAAPFITLYITNIAILGPALLIYGFHSGAGVLYFLYALLIWLITPVLPFVLTAIVIMYLMRFLNLSKNKDRIKIFAGLLMFVFIIGFNIVLRLDTGSNQAGEDLGQLVMESNALLEIITALFPSAYLSSISLTQPDSLAGIFYLFLLFILTAGVFMIFLTAGQKLYFKGVLGLSAGSKNRWNEKKVTKQIKQKNILYMSWLKEMKVMLRTPTFFTQIIVQSLVFPVLFIVIVVFDTGNGGLSAGGLSTLLAGTEQKYIILAMLGFTVFALGINPASISSVSRDGKSWFNHLYLPIQPSTVIYSKIIAAFTINLLTLIVLSVIGIIFIDLPLSIVLVWFALSLTTNWVTSVIGTSLDLYMPNLNWTDEREIFKGRMIGILALIVEVVVFGIILLILWNVSFITGLWGTSASLLVILTGLTLTSHIILKKMIYTRYTAIAS